MNRKQRRARKSYSGSSLISQQGFSEALKLFQSGAFAEAERLCSQNLEIEPRHVDSLNLLGLVFYQTGRAEAGVDLIKKAIKIKDDVPDFYNNLAFIFSKQGKLEEAAKNYQRAILLKPDMVDALAHLGNIQAELGHFEEAIASYRRAFNAKPDFVEVLVALGNVYKTQKDYDEAETYFRRAISLKPALTVAYNNLGTVLSDKSRFGEAVESYRRAIEIDPRYATAYNNMGTAYKNLKDFESAMKCYMQAVSLQPDYALAYSNIGTLFLEQGNMAEAIAGYQKALSINPDLLEVHNSLGNALKQSGDLTGAAACYERAISLNPDYTIGLFNLGSTLMEQGKVEESRPYLKRCFELDTADNCGARLLLAKIGEVDIPEKASDAHMQRLYAERAGLWDKNVTSNTLYRGHELVAHALNRLSGNQSLDILDIGCGTGLVGQRMREKAARLDGVDISAAMIEKAKEKSIYDGLYHDDLIGFMRKHVSSYDVITCAATLIHFGDLKTLLEAAFKSLKNDGLFIATLFPNEADADNYSVASANGYAQGGCYVHGRSYLKKIAEACSFSVEAMDTEIHEYRKGEPVSCLVLALKKQRE